MSCAKRGCKGTRKTQLYCRCGLVFCSETCFVSEWHADHRHNCPYAAEIKRTVNDTKSSTGKSGTALLVAAALSRTPPAQQGHADPVAGELPPPRELPRSREASASESPTRSPTRSPADEPSPAAQQVSTPVPSEEPRPAQQQLTSPVTPQQFASPATAAASTATQPQAPISPLPRTGSDPSPSAQLPSAQLPRPNSLPSSAPASAPAALGTTESTSSTSSRVTRYEKDEFVPVGGPIGNGSYGQVRKVVHKRTAELFAMKEIPKKKVTDHKMEEYLMREVRLQYKIRHPNILRLHYFFEDAEMVYLLLEYASGGSLFGHLRKKGRLPELEAAPIFVGVSKALNFMHKNNIVHRDLKPENILMCAGGVAKIADFGWSAEMKDGAPRMTFCGTWDYLSPEMVQNEPHDHTVDTWAVGVLLYEMITGRAPFSASNQMKALNRITNVDLQVPEFVSMLAKDVICKILIKDRRKRLSLEDAIRHEWARRFVRIEDEPPAANATLQQSAPSAAGAGVAPSRAAEQSAVASVVERPVPKPKALANSGERRSREQEDTGQGRWEEGSPQRRVEADRQNAMDGIRRVIADISREREAPPAVAKAAAPAVPPPAPVADVMASSSPTEARVAREEARAMISPEAAKVLEDLRKGSQKTDVGSQPAVAKPKNVAEKASSRDDMFSPEPRALPAADAQVRDAPRVGIAPSAMEQTTSYAETDVFKSIRNWARKDSRKLDVLAAELDQTVPLKPGDSLANGPPPGASRSKSWAATIPEQSGTDVTAEDGTQFSKKAAREISPIRRSWDMPDTTAVDETKRLVTREISPVTCGRDVASLGSPSHGKSTAWQPTPKTVDEVMLDDTVQVNKGASDQPRRIVNGASVNMGG